MRSIPWVRTVALAVVPLVLAALAGGLLWLVMWLGVPGAATLGEAGPGALLAIGVLLGGRFEGAFVHLQSDGVAVVALLVPVLAGLLIARWIPPIDRHVLAGAGLVVTAGFHATLLGGASLLEVYDPTSLQTASVAWMGLATPAFAGVTWATAWAVSQWDLGRTMGLGAAASALLGALGLTVGALGAEPGAVATSALAGLLAGPNVLVLSVVGLLGAEVTMSGGGASDLVGTGGLAGEFGWWLWAVPIVGIGLVVLAAVRAEVPESGVEFGRRARDVTGSALVVLAAAATLASPRIASGSGSEAWISLAGGPAALWLPLVLLIALVLVPLVARALWQGETWPGAPLRALQEAAARARTAPPAQQSPSSTASWGRPSTPTGHPTAAPHGASPPAYQQPPAAGWQPPPQHAAPAAPTPGSTWPTGAPAHHAPHNPFGEDAPPPVSDAWRDVPAAPSDPASGPPPAGEGQR